MVFGLGKTLEDLLIFAYNALDIAKAKNLADKQLF